MRKIVIFMMLVIGAYVAPITANAEKLDIPFIPVEPIDSLGKGHIPKKPLFCPISGYREGEELTLFSATSGEAEIIIVDEANSPIYHDIIVLYDEFYILLESKHGSIYVTIGSHTYKAQF